jgi:hypothetical protein
MDSYPFTCPPCEQRLAKKGGNNKKTLSNNVNKRTAKAQQKKQSTEIYDFIQHPALSSSSQNNRQNPLSG